MAEREAKNITPINIEDEMRSSYMDYAMSVIIGRALPDARDGLKPVHRRVLYTMNETHSTHAAAYKKSARIVGDVMGKYHPHGDSAIYDTIVRMAQDFSLRYMLVDGQGNFGSVDGDAPAAMRYTEIRMQRLAEEMLADIDKETVSMVPNYDGSLKEPEVLPARVPNLLVNGSAGIAVGMSTNIPPHHLGEVVDGVIALIKNPDITIDELMEIIPAPDFPTGGFIMGKAGIRSAYETGRGSVKMKARTSIEETKKGDRASIVVTEIPYQVNKARLLERIADLHKEKRVEGISDLRDESDREGMRIVVDLKRDADPQVTLNQLFAMTPLKTSFSVILLAIVKGRPKLLTLKDALFQFVEHRKAVVTRRTLYELRKAEEREHLLLGYEIAIDNLDAVIALIRKSKDPEEAKSGLCSQFGLSLIQAKAILEMRLERLTRMERDKITNELEAIRKLIARFQKILGSEKVLMNVIEKELVKLRDQYGDPRRCELVEDEDDLSIEDLIPEEDMVVTASQQGFIKRTPVAVYQSQNRAGKGKAGMKMRDEDHVTKMFVASTHTWVLFFTNKGRVFRVRVYNIPQGTRQSKGRAIVNLLQLAGDEKVEAILSVKDFEENQFLVFATRKGLVKRTDLSLYRNIRSNGIAAIKLDPGDDLISVRFSGPDGCILLFSREGKSIRFLLEDARPIGRVTRGVRGMRLKGKDEVIGMEFLGPDSKMHVLAVTERGYGKRTPEDAYRVQRRAGAGVLAMRTTKRVGLVMAMRSVVPTDELLMTSNKGTTIRLRASEIRIIGRVTQGVRLMNLARDEQVVAVDVLAEPEDEEDVQPPTTKNGKTAPKKAATTKESPEEKKD